MECKDYPTDEQSELERKLQAKLEPHRAALSGESDDPSSALDDLLQGSIGPDIASYQRKRVNSELEQYSVIWDRISAQDVKSFSNLLKENPDESAMQEFLKAHQKFLAQTMRYGHGRYQISKVRLGSQHIPDFLLAEMSSIGLEWHAVELESPKLKLCRKNGLQTSKLTHAIGQIRDWRTWFRNNRDYARRPETEGGLGLIGIDDRVSGLIVMGRRIEYPERFNEFRRQTKDRENIEIHSYDWLLDIAVQSVNERTTRGPRR